MTTTGAFLVACLIGAIIAGFAVLEAVSRAYAQQDQGSGCLLWIGLFLCIGGAVGAAFSAVLA